MAQTGIVTDLAEAIEKVEIMFAKVVQSDGPEYPYIKYLIAGRDRGQIVQAWYDCMLAAMSRTTRQRLIWRKRPDFEPHPMGLMLVSMQTME
jgi:hypothetical protein